MKHLFGLYQTLRTFACIGWVADANDKRALTIWWSQFVV